MHTINWKKAHKPELLFIHLLTLQLYVPYASLFTAQPDVFKVAKEYNQYHWDVVL